MLEIRLLGQYELHKDTKPVDISTRPARTLLAYLLLTRGIHHPRDKLAGLLWPESSEQNARKNLRQTLWRLRKELGDPYFLIDTNSISFNASSEYWLDAAVLDDEAGQDLEASISVYDGELLPGFYDDWVLLERDRMAASFEHKMHQFLKRLGQEKRWMDVLTWAERWIARGQTPESAYRALMRAHAELGEVSKVQADYRRCVQALQDDLEVDPSEETERLYHRLLAGERISPEQPLEDLPVAEISLINLPAQVTAFIGRTKELEEIQELLLNTRLLSITGPGGIGKTRLAIEAAAVMADAFTHGCHFVSLAPIREVDHVAQAIAEALKFPLATHEDPEVQLFRYLQHRQLLLVIDNLEHLLDAVAILNEIIHAAPEVKIVATSREKLNVQGETNLVIAGLDTFEFDDAKATPSSDAAALFLQSARRTRHDFSPTPQELEHISRICQFVGGMPLAIELAAAWLHVLRVEDIAAELEMGYDILETDKRDALDRHRSIRTVFDQSWSRLSASEQAVFTELSIFRGGFRREAAHEVAAASLHQLAVLVNKSFLSHDPHTGRFEIHELLRQFADERLEERGDAKDSLVERYAAYYANFMEARTLQLRGKKHQIVLEEIVGDIQNVRAAWRFYLYQRNTAMLWKFITGLWHVYWLRWWNHAGMELFEEAVTVLSEMEDDESRALCGQAMVHQSFFMAWVGIPESGYRLAEESVEILVDHDLPEALALAYESISFNAYFFGRMSEERESINKMYAIAEELEDPWLIAFSLFALGMLNLLEGDYAEAQRVAERNLEIYEEIGDVSGLTMPMIILGHVALARGELDKAIGRYLETLRIAEEIGFHYSIQTASKYIGKVSISQGNLLDAEKYLRLSLTITRDIGFARDIINLLYEFARLRVAQDKRDVAVELLTFVNQHPLADQARWLEGSIEHSAKGLLAEIEQVLPTEMFEAAVERGRAMELNDVVAQILM